MCVKVQAIIQGQSTWRREGLLNYYDLKNNYCNTLENTFAITNIEHIFLISIMVIKAIQWQNAISFIFLIQISSGA